MTSTEVPLYSSTSPKEKHTLRGSSASTAPPVTQVPPGRKTSTSSIYPDNADCLLNSFHKQLTLRNTHVITVPALPNVPRSGHGAK